MSAEQNRSIPNREGKDGKVWSTRMSLILHVLDASEHPLNQEKLTRLSNVEK